jgi:hypothetical protein
MPPPLPLEYQGWELAGRSFATGAFREGRPFRLVQTRANGQAAFGVYIHDRLSGVTHAFGVLVITLSGDKVSAIIGCLDNAVLAHFGLPQILPS